MNKTENKFDFSGFVEKKNIENYIKLRDKYANKCRNNSNFRRAVVEMNNFIADPEKHRSNATARVVKIKSEKDIHQHLGIKVKLENDCTNEHQALPTTYSDGPKIKASMNEKSNLVAEIVSLKSENQKICFELNKKKNELIIFKQENEQKFRQLNEQITALSSKLKVAEAEAYELKKTTSEKQALDAKRISDLISENKVLTARIKQIQSGALLNSPSVKEHSVHEDPDVFEVEKVIDDRMKGKKREYLIRWKGYGPKDDTWEKADNLMCPSILEDYMESKKN